MKRIDYIVLHRSESNWGNLKIIDKWHRDKGFSKIGYNWVVLNQFPTSVDYRGKKPSIESDGKIEIGRSSKVDGAHCYGYNDVSIGICMIGTRHFTSKQLASVRYLVNKVLQEHPDAKLVGHCELREDKPNCPNVDMDYIREYCLA